MTVEYRHNHYVPEWYQKRFLPPGQKNQELYYLDLTPKFFVDPKGIARRDRGLKHWGFKKCFAQDDLYTTRFGGVEERKIEELFFGHIDTNGRNAVEAWTKFSHSSFEGNAFNYLVLYMSTQKLRTPKGLGWLAWQAGVRRKSEVLTYMMQVKDLHSAIWTECVWLLADASQSKTKFIVSDHPVTVYNRASRPGSIWCMGWNDPDIDLRGTHTIFPLSLDKILILTNLAWVRNPYKSAAIQRPNARRFRTTMFKGPNAQLERHLTEEEVRQINFVIKARAWRYIGAAKEEWLYPEKHVSVWDWPKYGHGYLLMPDPRGVHIGGTLMMGGGKGPPFVIDEYGRFPWEPDFEKETRTGEEWTSLERFQGEFSRLFGQYRRGRNVDVGHLAPEKESDEMHAYYLSREEKYR